MYIFSPYKYL